MVYSLFFFQAEDGRRDLVRSRGLGDVYKRQESDEFARHQPEMTGACAAQCTEMRATTQLLADVVRISADIKALAAHLSLIHI